MMPAARKTTKKTAKKTTAKKAASGQTSSSRPRKKKLPDGMTMEDMTRVRAYELWEERGGGGDEMEDWTRAESEVSETYRV